MAKVRTRDEYLQIFRKVVTKVKYSLENWDFEDINLASRGGSKRGAFILGSCFIDHLSCFYFGHSSTSSNYACFVDRFLPMYNGQNMYTDLRCKLVHNYSLGNQYALTHNRSKLHLKKDIDGKILINLKNFITEIKQAKEQYFAELKNDEQLQINFAKWYINGGVLVPVNSSVPPKKT